MKNLILIFIASAFLVCCHDSQKCPYAFYLPAQLSPAQLEYHVGDTITVTSKFHREVLAFNTEGNEVGFFNMDGVEWMPVTGIYRIDTESGELNSVVSEDFDFVENPVYNYKIESTSLGTILIGEYNLSQDSFSLFYRLIPLQTGVYLHEFGSWAGIADSQPFEGRWPGDFAVFMEVNKGMDNNISLLSESPNPHFNTWTLLDPQAKFYEMGGFAFRVVP